ncbi:DUF2457 domain-containing protein [Aspergillus homomorphus CBS 101889]|uniref:Uncharacterized protein n=1 Tax=Aspergillus homomorphus (strain CBS 101889) TaxID=1450537 RepID=A0A395HP31_ASPHC|nr:hypothetical protein BO97DRAFT_351200 [Aspergillus homomorphus CBS 101889]RAL09691.1 hypothetical protein BO97DRAFT_351200 [Aspergillus homomorphus CBS 101889]
MAQLRGGERPFASIHNLLKMLLSPHQSNKSAPQDTDMGEDMDEPPDHRFLNTSMSNMDEGVVYVKSPTAMSDRKESLLTRALKNSPPLSPTEQPSSSHEHSFYRSYTYTNISGISTAELTSDGGLTSPSLSNTPSPPLPSHMTSKPSSMGDKRKAEAVEGGEHAVEANLGRKRCISFACGRKTEEQSAQTPQRSTTKTNDSSPTPTEPKRKTVLTFVCPARDPETRRERSPTRASPFRCRPRGSPAPLARKVSPKKETLPAKDVSPEKPPTERRGVPTKGLGKFEESEATRFHEFASSVDEDDEWVTKSGDYDQKITLNDCMKKEFAIRKLGEEAEEEALDEEAEEDAEDSDDDSTVHDFSSDDDGNESDNEAGFADSDDESENGSDYEWWAPTSTTAATSPQAPDFTRFTFSRRNSNTSFDSANDSQQAPKWSPAFSGKTTGRVPMKIPKLRPGTPNLPDSTDFVCGTFDEDRPLEAAYKSCIEQRRLSKQIIIPQDIDPSFPTSDPEDNEDIDEEDVDESLPDEGPRGRTGRDSSRKASPRQSPKRMRMVSPPPRRHGRASPRRLKSPPPMKLRSSTQNLETVEEVPAQGLNISELVQRPSMSRTKSLPRTPNPFFTSLDKSHRWSGIVPVQESPERELSRTREVHTRGPIDIVEGLEKKRQKRKEKFWRTHCRKAAKEQMERRPVPGKGAERMKELGLEVAERCRAYGVGESAQLVLSV